MISWVIANPISRRIALYAVVTLVIFWFIRVYGNGRYDSGVMEGKKSAAAALEKRFAEEMRRKEAENAERMRHVEESLVVARTAANEVKAERDRLRRDIDALRYDARVRSESAASGVPDDRLWDEIRAVSERLAADGR